MKVCTIIIVAILLIANSAMAGSLVLSDIQKKNLGIELQAVSSTGDLPLIVLPSLVTPVADGRVAVAVPFGGTVVRVHVVEGQIVEKGQALVTLFSRDFLAAQSVLIQVRSEYEMTAAEAQRVMALAEDGIVSGARLDEAKAHLFQAKARLQEHSHLVSMVKPVPRQPGHYQLTAPIAGRISRIAASPGLGIDVMTSAITVDNADRLWLEAQLPADLAVSVKPGQMVTVDGGKGTVVAVGSAIDPKTRSLLVRAEISGSSGMLLGSTAMMVIRLPPGHSGFAVSQSAVTKVAGQDSVFVEDPTGFHVVNVQVVGHGDSELTVVGSLEPGQRIAISGISELKALAGKN